MTFSSNRREWFLAAGTITAASNGTMMHSSSAADTAANAVAIASPKLALNTSTLRGHQLSVPEQIRVTAAAGYDGIEPWIRDLRAFVDDGGQIRDLRSQLDEAGLQMSGAIGFAKWIVDDDSVRAAGLDEARRDMELVSQLGGQVIAAPPIGAHRLNELGPEGPPSLDVIAERYHALLDLGDEMGVTPLLELWGFAPVLSKLGELAYVSAAAGHASAAVLPDFYHIYKGGNSMSSLGMIEASRMPLFHINDYPASPPIADIADKDRVFPGDGVCDLVPVIAMLLRHGFAGTFSLELFNPDYWAQPAGEVAQTGFEKSRQVLDAAIELAINGPAVIG